MATFLDAAGAFTTPRILRSSEDVLVLSTLQGPTLYQLGENDSAASDESFAWEWEKWARSWIAQLSLPHGRAARSFLDSLPLRSAEVEAADLRRCVNRWLRHFENVPEMSPQASALRAVAEDVTRNLLGTAPDPLVWSHGDLHGEQIIVAGGRSPLGLLDFDEGAQAEAALDLASMDMRLELRRRRNHMSRACYHTAHLQVMAVAQELHVNPDRFHAYSDSLWLREALVPRPGRLDMATAVLDERAKQYQPTQA
ncbi:phosphotransferase [Arthrobacter oryzae]|uniref:phosphotransferase n=1 Tax=Arthrobacter oryzae TaxID=409290 RepID=UPI001FC957AE|nr:phosphotransferase [Arthrobacter oryzae]